MRNCRGTSSPQWQRPARWLRVMEPLAQRSCPGKVFPTAMLRLRVKFSRPSAGLRNWWTGPRVPAALRLERERTMERKRLRVGEQRRAYGAGASSRWREQKLRAADLRPACPKESGGRGRCVCRGLVARGFLRDIYGTAPADGLPRHELRNRALEKALSSGGFGRDHLHRDCGGRVCADRLLELDGCDRRRRCSREGCCCEGRVPDDRVREDRLWDDRVPDDRGDDRGNPGEWSAPELGFRARRPDSRLPLPPR